MSASQLLNLQAEWASRGWGLDTLELFRMETNPGDLGGGGGGGDAGGGATPPADGAGAGQGSQEYSPIATGFLGRVPAEHRALVEPYVKQWDAGVTRQFQELHSQLNPYKELGDLEQLQAAQNLMQRLEANPWEIYGILKQSLETGEYGPQPTGPPVATAQQPTPQEQGLPGDLPPAVVQRLDGLQQIVVAMAQQMLGQQQTSTQQAQDEALNNALSQAHEEFGDFDEDAVMAKYMKDPSKSIADHAGAYMESLNTLLAQRQGGMPQNNLPVILGGGAGGALPGGNTDVRKLDRGQTQSLIAEVLAKTHQS